MVSSAHIPGKVRDLVKKTLRVALFLILMSHAVGTLLPETGFDALWYHLPIVKDMALTHSIRVVPSVTQSNQPRLGELIFLPGFLAGQELGVKFTTFVIMLVLLWLTFRLSRLYLSDLSSLAVMVVVASFQTVAWGASSAYVDLLRAVFELGLFYCLLSPAKTKERELILILGLLAGTLLTKLVTLIFLPSLLLFIFLKRGMKTTLWALILTIGIYSIGHYPLSFFWTTGQSLISPRVVVDSILSLIFMPWTLSFHAESYLTPLFIFAVPFLIAERRWFLAKYKAESLFLFFSLVTWVFVAPISVRYDLSAIVLTTILCTVVILASAKRHLMVRSALVVLLMVSVFANMLIRVGANLRSVPFLLGSQTQAEYLKMFDNGILKGPLEAWYKTL